MLVTADVSECFIPWTVRPAPCGEKSVFEERAGQRDAEEDDPSIFDVPVFDAGPPMTKKHKRGQRGPRCVIRSLNRIRVMRRRPAVWH